MNKILLNDIFHLSEDELNNTKIRFIYDEDDKDVWKIYEDEFKNNSNENEITDIWFLYKKENQPNLFHEGNLALCFLKMKGTEDNWLFVSAKRIKEKLDNKDNGVHYKGEDYEKLSKFIRKLVIKYKKAKGEQCQSYWANNDNHFIQKLEVLSLDQISADYHSKQILKRIINTSSKKQLDTYVDVISALQKHL